MPEERRKLAEALVQSLRGQYIIGQALDVAIEVMEKAERPETSNIRDMKLLRDELFPIAYATRLAQEGWEEQDTHGAV